MRLVQQMVDSVAAGVAGQAVRPDTLGAPPLPGGVAAVVRAVFSAPTWLWLVVIALVVAAGVVAAVTTWRRRAALATWLAGHRRGVRIALAAGALALALGVAGAGAASWNYLQHDNGFCAGCHVMTPSFQAMQTSTVHDTLQCHDCHQQPITASLWQLYLWLRDRPERIGKHAEVANATCERCHQTGAARERWQRVATTAGHRVHLESDSTALRDVQCTSCHGEEVHRFVPADRTCGQSGCHAPDATRIAIGAMASQSALHCVTCHQFTAELPQLAGLDSAAGAMRPGRQQCLSCHAMEARLAGFEIARDPHGGQCGLCHNPHLQAQPRDVRRSCATAGCHGGWRDIPFHVGAAHRRAGPRCETCHAPHAARVDASDCAGCHADVARRLPGRAPPLPFDTARALPRSALPPHEPVPERGAGARKEAGKLLRRSALEAAAHAAPSAPPDTFSHDRHRSLACLTCHPVRGGARLTFAAPRGCAICHHQAPAEGRCGTCHEAGELAPPRPASLRVAVGERPARARAVEFHHEAHASTACTACHRSPVTLEAADSVRTCTACHADHHAPRRSCEGCHATETRASHALPADAHTGCDACHRTAAVASLSPDRALCLTCHAPQRNHYEGRECAPCHFLADPEALRGRLVRPAGRRGARWRLPRHEEIFHSGSDLPGVSGVY